MAGNRSAWGVPRPLETSFHSVKFRALIGYARNQFLNFPDESLVDWSTRTMSPVPECSVNNLAHVSPAQYVFFERIHKRLFLSPSHLTHQNPTVASDVRLRLLFLLESGNEIHPLRDVHVCVRRVFPVESLNLSL